MIKFVLNNWKMLLVSALATTAAAVCVFNPPAFVAASIIGLTSSPVFAIFGAYAAQAATATVALAAAASTFLGAAVLNAGFNLASRLLSACWARIRPNGSAPKGSTNDEEDFDLGPDSTSTLGVLGQSKRGPKVEEDLDLHTGETLDLSGRRKRVQRPENDETLDQTRTTRLGMGSMDSVE